MNKKIISYLVIMFIIFLTWGLLIQPLNCDEVWNYGFVHNIYKGLIPYRDFNMVITPFYPLIMSLGFFLFGSSMLVLHIENALILTILSYLLYKLLKEKSLLLLLLLFIPLPIVFPSYNLFLLFLFVLLITLEKEKRNDYLIGLILSLCFLTKQSVGIFLFLSNIIYIKDLSKIKKRLLGFIIPIILFIIYLLLTNSFIPFIDLCFLGLFDFAEKNNNSFNICYVLFILFLITILVMIKKKSKEIIPYYTLSFLVLNIPIFDYYHTQLVLISVLILLFYYYDYQLKLHIIPFFFSIILILSISILSTYQNKLIYPNDIPHFEYKLLDKDTIEFTKEISIFIKNHSKEEIVYLNANGYYIKLVNDIPINYLDLINNGNWGYHGENKMMEIIKEKREAIFLVDLNELSEIRQSNKKIIRYVIDNGIKVGNLGIYEIYKMK